MNVCAHGSVRSLGACTRPPISSDRDAHIPGLQSLAACPARPVHSRRLGPPAQAARAPRSTCPSCSGSITPSLARSFITIVYGIGAANWASPEGVIGSESNPRAHVSSSIQARAVPSPWLLVARLYDPGDRAPCQFTPWRAISELRKTQARTVVAGYAHQGGRFAARLYMECTLFDCANWAALAAVVLGRAASWFWGSSQGVGGRASSLDAPQMCADAHACCFCAAWVCSWTCRLPGCVTKKKSDRLPNRVCRHFNLFSIGFHR